MANTPDPSHHGPALARTMGLFALVIYGVGDMLGTGIYGLVGVAARDMGNMIWLAFLTSMIAAMLTGLSYASLGSRYPRAAGAAYVTQRAFNFSFLSYVVGLTVMASGLTSMATASRAFAEYFRNFLLLPPALIIVGFILLLTFINFWGMRESTWMNLLCTLIEAGGLIFVIAVGLRYWGSVSYLDPTSTRNPAGTLSIPFVLQGAVLTFYSFIGFEDMLNVAEEVKDVRRTFPRGMVIALAITTLIYMAVSITAISVVPHQELALANGGTLARGQGPLVKVVSVAAPWLNVRVFAAIGLFAIANTALLNYIMGSRLAYGMARQGLLPHLLGRVHPTRRTPHLAILALMVLVLLLALAGDISDLASATSLLLLGVFVVINLALIVLKRRPNEPPGLFEVPLLVPLGGMLVCLAMIGTRVYAALLDPAARRAPLIAAAIGTGAALLYLITRPKHLDQDTLAHLTD